MTEITGDYKLHPINAEIARRSARAQAIVQRAGPRPTPLIPRNLDFSFPLAHADSWSITAADVIEASVAELMAKERRLGRLLHQAVMAGEHDRAPLPATLGDSQSEFSLHVDALAALSSQHSWPVIRTMHRVLGGAVERLRTVGKKLLKSCSSYPSTLYELYVATSDVTIGYVALQATALSLGDRCAAAVAARHLRHAGELLLTLHVLVPFEFVRELQAHGFPATTDELWEVAGVSTLSG